MESHFFWHERFVGFKCKLFPTIILLVLCFNPIYKFFSPLHLGTKIRWAIIIGNCNTFARQFQFHFLVYLLYKRCISIALHKKWAVDSYPQYISRSARLFVCLPYKMPVDPLFFSAGLHENQKLLPQNPLHSCNFLKLSWFFSFLQHCWTFTRM